MTMIQQRIKTAKPMTWVFTGDSITHGALHTYGWRSYPEHFAERLRYEMERSYDIVINTGISGETAGDILKSFDWRVSRFNPDVVSVMIGTNDCVDGEAGRTVFRKNLIEMVTRIKTAGAIPLLNTPNTICVDGYDGTRKDLHNYVQIIRDVAVENDIQLIDHWQYWQQHRDTNDQLMLWLSDSIHPNEYGHRVLANEVLRALGMYDSKSQTCKLSIP